MDGRKVVVGLTPEQAVGDVLSGGYTLSYAAPFASVPLLFGQMQTATDDITSTLRIQKRDQLGATLIRDREKSTSYVSPGGEQVGYMLIGPSETDGIVNIHNTVASPRIYDTMGRRVLLSRLRTGLYLIQHPDGTISKQLVK